MNTQILTDPAAAAAVLRAGGLAALPTETVYGLAGNGLDAGAVERIYAVKGRPAVKPLSLLVPDAGALEDYCEPVPPAARALAARFWPGPLTLVLRSKGREPAVVRAGGDTLGLRCPDHPLTLAVLRLCGVPLAAPSANPSGAPSPKTAAAVLDYFGGAIEAVADGGACGLGRESTILDLSQTPYRVLRQGALEEAELDRALRESLTLVGITGGSGCGKTTALAALADLGALVLDADAVYHELTVSSAPMRRELTARFGDVYDGDALDRRRLAAVVFSDPAALADLNAITHKYVRGEMDRRLTDHARNGGTLAAIDAIALLESGAAAGAAFTVAVTAPPERRVERLCRRDGITPEQARARIAAQRPETYYTAGCDYVLRNDGTQAQFAQKCAAFFREKLGAG